MSHPRPWLPRRPSAPHTSKVPRRPLTLALLLLVGVAAGCGGGGDSTSPPPGDGDPPPPPPPPPPAAASIAGSVSHMNFGVGSVVIRLSGPDNASGEQTTEDDGTFSFGDLAEGSWTLEIDPPDYFLIPEGDSSTREVTLSAGQNASVEVTLVPSEPTELEEVEMLAISFSRPNLNVRPGTRVRWRNTVDDFHTVTPQGHNQWTRGTVNAPGDTFEAVLNNPGTFNYFCEPHQSLGMTGVIQVSP